MALKFAARNSHSLSCVCLLLVNMTIRMRLLRWSTSSSIWTSSGARTNCFFSNSRFSTRSTIGFGDAVNGSSATCSYFKPTHILQVLIASWTRPSNYKITWVLIPSFSRKGTRSGLWLCPCARSTWPCRVWCGKSFWRDLRIMFLSSCFPMLYLMRLWWHRSTNGTLPL